MKKRLGLTYTMLCIEKWQLFLGQEIRCEITNHITSKYRYFTVEDSFLIHHLKKKKFSAAMPHDVSIWHRPRWGVSRRPSAAIGLHHQESRALRPWSIRLVVGVPPALVRSVDSPVKNGSGHTASRRLKNSATASKCHPANARVARWQGCSLLGAGLYPGIVFPYLNLQLLTRGGTKECDALVAYEIFRWSREGRGLRFLM